MRKIEITCRYAAAGSRGISQFKYYVTADELSDADGEIEVEAYGVGVSSGAEESNARALTMSHKKAERLAGRLAAGLVTPVSLRDIIEDILAA